MNAPLGFAWLAMFATSMALAQSQGMTAQTLFEKPPSQGEYRIPGVLALPDGTVLVFCADRKGRGDFGHDTTTVMRSSTDGGKTWGPIHEIAARHGADIHSGPVVYDRSRDRLFKFCRYWPAAKNARDITRSKAYRQMAEQGWIDHWQVSDDRGRTWTEPEPIRLDYPSSVYSAATGNGVHGIQTRSGRMLIQGGYSERVGERLLRRCCTFASDDHGATWKRLDDMDTAEINVIREFVMAEKSSGDIYFNLRSTKGRRSVFDGNRVRDDDQLLGIGCHAGLSVWQREHDPIWVFSHPSPSEAAAGKGSSVRRQRLVLRLSDDEGKTWPKEILVHEHAAAYSDVAVLDDGTALVFFENGDAIGEPYQRISIARIPLADHVADGLQASDEDTAIHVGTPLDVVDKMLEVAKVTKQDVLFDLGCGDGRIVIAAAKKTGCRAVGYDIDLRKVLQSRRNVAEAGIEKRVRIEQQDIFKLDLSQASVITLYLLPEMNEQLIPQLKKLRPGSRVVSHDFPILGAKPDQKLTIKSAETEAPHDIYLYTSPLKLVAP